jgi:branched-chain amino acid transport system substrate-binding protein
MKRIGQPSVLRRHITALLLVLAMLQGAAPDRSNAATPYDVHVVLPLTGGAAFVGKGQQTILQLFEAHVNQTGGIRGQDLHFVFHDDQTNPAVAVQLTNQILADRPAVILGSAITAMCNAMAPLMTRGPVMYCLSPGIRPVAGGYVFSAFTPTESLIQALLRYFRMKGWTRIASLSSTDASGQDADLGLSHILNLPENAAVHLIDQEHFSPTDISVQAQIERIKAANPQALIAWTTGAQVATIFRAVSQAHLDIPVATSPGNQQFSQLDQYVGFLPPGLVMPSGLYPPHPGLFTLDRRVERAQAVMEQVLGAAHLKADNATSTSWDPALIVVSALRALGPSASAEQIRSYIADLTDFPGIDGLYDFKKVPQRGLDVQDAVIIRFDPAGERWVWMSKPGGVPLAGG